MGAIHAHHGLLLPGGGGGTTDPLIAYVVSILNMPGADGSTTITEAIGGHTWTAHGGAQIDTSAGYNACQLTSFGDFIDTPSHADFGFGSGDYCIEVFASSSTQSSAVNLICDTRTGANTGVAFFIGNTVASGKNNQLGAASNSAQIANGGTTANNTRYHLALARQGTTLRGFVDGVQAFSVTDSRTYASASQVVIGADYVNTSGQNFSGLIQAARITKGHARYTANFTPPTFGPFPTS